MSRAARGRQRLHQVGRLVHLVVGRELAVIQVRRERDEPGGPETVGPRLDARIEAPPLLDDEHARTRSPGRRHEIPRGLVPVAWKLDDLCHATLLDARLRI
jgi:hypothetical protein